jgi:hypothetical protein
MPSSLKESVALDENLIVIIIVNLLTPAILCVLYSPVFLNLLPLDFLFQLLLVLSSLPLLSLSLSFLQFPLCSSSA